MTVAKELKSLSIPVLIDISSETGKLPKEIQTAYRAAGGAMPFVVLTDPAMTKVYGSYSHTSLKGQDYRTIFRDAKRAATADIKADTFNVTLDASAPKKADAAVAKNDQTEDKVKSSSADIVKIEDPQMLSWRSSKGTSIKARLISVEGGKIFVFKTDSGRVIKVPGEQLSKTSLADARLIAGLE